MVSVIPDSLEAEVERDVIAERTVRLYGLVCVLKHAAGMIKLLEWSAMAH
jgi:hypothetical protein